MESKEILFALKPDDGKSLGKLCIAWIILLVCDQYVQSNVPLKQPGNKLVNSFLIINDYSSKWRWIMVDIYWAAKQRGKYPPLPMTLKLIIVFSIYHTDTKKNSWFL